MTYWIDEDKGFVFCLIEAPDKESVRVMHEKSHGLIPNEIIQVNTDAVTAFLGRIKDPEHAIVQAETNIKIFSDPAFRIILVTKTKDARLLQHHTRERKNRGVAAIIQHHCSGASQKSWRTRSVSKEEGFVISFISASQAMECALAVQKKLLSVANLIGLRIGLHGGVPVTKNDSIFGDTIRFAQFLCSVSKDNQIATSSVVRNLYKDNDWSLAVRQNDIRWLTAAEENFLETLVDTLDSHWHDPEFDVPIFVA